MFSTTGEISDLERLYDENAWTKDLLLGRGRVASVYLYTNKITKCHVAVKQFIFDPLKENSSNYLNKFLSERKTLALLSHERIVTYYNYILNEEACICSIGVEYMAGGTLHSLLRLTGPLTLNKTKLFIKQLLEGVIYLHKKCIVHNDIKGQNILLDNTGNNVKLCDFGSAADVSLLIKNLIFSSWDSEFPFSKYPLCKYRMNGTTHWMAPERIYNEISIKSDVWSIGCTVVEMLTSLPPWHSNQEITVMYNLSLGKYPSYNLPQSSEIAEEFLQSCFKTEPDLRHSAEQLMKTNFCVNT